MEDLLTKKRSCQGGKFVRMVQNELSPLYLVPNQLEQHEEHIFHLWPRYNRHWYVLVEGQSLRGKYQLGQFHAHQRWLPRTVGENSEKMGK